MSDGQTKQGLFKKPWKSQTERTKKSERKVLAGIDALGKHVSRPGEGLTRADILARARVMLTQHPDGFSSLECLLHFLAARIFDALRCKQDEIFLLEHGWDRLISIIDPIRPDVSRALLNNPHFKSGFIWQISGHAEQLRKSVDPIENVLICEQTKGRDKGNVQVAFQLKDGKILIPPKDYVLPHPTFLYPGDVWAKKRVSSYRIVNMYLPWPCPELEDAIKLVLWEPKKKSVLSQMR